MLDLMKWTVLVWEFLFSCYADSSAGFTEEYFFRLKMFLIGLSSITVPKQMVCSCLYFDSKLYCEFNNLGSGSSQELYSVFVNWLSL